MAPKTKAKKQYRHVEIGQFCVVATFNNTIITCSDTQGKPLFITSTGQHGFIGTRRSTPYAATVTTESAIKKAIENHGMRRVEIMVKGIGPGREAAIRSFKNSLLEVEKLIDATPVPHNGVRPPKLRRV